MDLPCTWATTIGVKPTGNEREAKHNLSLVSIIGGRYYMGKVKKKNHEALKRCGKISGENMRL